MSDPRRDSKAVAKGIENASEETAAFLKKLGEALEKRMQAQYKHVHDLVETAILSSASGHKPPNWSQSALEKAADKIEKIATKYNHLSHQAKVEKTQKVLQKSNEDLEEKQPSKPRMGSGT